MPEEKNKRGPIILRSIESDMAMFRSKMNTLCPNSKITKRSVSPGPGQYSV